MTGITYPDDSTASFVYDGAGNRVSKTEGSVTTKFLYDGERVQAEYNSSWQLQLKYTLEGDSYYDPAISMKRDYPYYYMNDGLGSTRKLLRVAQGESVTDSYSYDAFGNIVSSSGNTANRYRYVGSLGYYADSTSGLLHVGARYYNPKVGRFLTQDPIGYAGGINLFRYVRNNPALWIDPAGERLDHRNAEEDLGAYAPGGSIYDYPEREELIKELDYLGCIAREEAKNQLNLGGRAIQKGLIAAIRIIPKVGKKLAGPATVAWEGKCLKDIMKRCNEEVYGIQESPVVVPQISQRHLKKKPIKRHRKRSRRKH